jgi:nucleotidyltransferase/DNA polymerase involved in DNA repair
MKLTPLQSAAYDAWRTAGPPEDPLDSFSESIESLSLRELHDEREDLKSSEPDEDCPRHLYRQYLNNWQQALAAISSQIDEAEQEYTSMLESLSPDELLLLSPEDPYEIELLLAELDNRGIEAPNE